MSKKNKGEKKGFFGRLFGAGKEGEAGGATPPAGGEDPGELTMAPGYAPPGETPDPLLFIAKEARKWP